MLKDRLCAADQVTVLLDGDTLRAILGDTLGHTRQERLQLALIYGRLCKELTSQGVNVVCATISMFRQVHQWNRENIPDYREIYLSVPNEELVRRDAKGIYRQASSSGNVNLVGFDQQAELPENPDLIIDNHGNTSPDEALEKIWNALGK